MATLFPCRKPRTAFAVCAAVVLLGLAALTAGCATPWGNTTLGTATDKPVATVAVRDVLRDKTPAPNAPAEIRAVKGTIVEKCPVAGCWFMLRDSTGTIKVDTKEAGFVVTDIPLGTTVQATGTVAADANERHIVAASLRY